MNLHHKIKWDLVGVTVSGLCIMHCILLPVVLLLVPVLGTYTHFLEDYTHRIFLGLVIAAAGLSFVPGYRVHRHIWPSVIALAGISILGAVAMGGAHELGHDAEPIIAGVGSCLLITAHWVNHQKCKKCTSHSCAED